MQDLTDFFKFMHCLKYFLINNKYIDNLDETLKRKVRYTLNRNDGKKYFIQNIEDKLGFKLYNINIKLLVKL